jgi:hypothetical protein
VGKISFFPKWIGLHDEVSTDHDQPTSVVARIQTDEENARRHALGLTRQPELQLSSQQPAR